MQAMSDEPDEHPSTVLFENHQWQVTDYGMESAKPAPTYHFEGRRLLETQGAGMGEMYDWPVHMAEKTWVDVEAFIEAFTQALKLHSDKIGKVNDDMLRASLAKARREAQSR
jgi:hypothetical protein